MNELLIEFERHVGLGPTKAALLLGFKYPTYAQYRSGEREIQEYGLRSIQVIMLLTRSQLNALIKEHVFNGRNGR